jgi:hypothetical protein
MQMYLENMPPKQQVVIAEGLDWVARHVWRIVIMYVFLKEMIEEDGVYMYFFVSFLASVV